MKSRIILAFYIVNPSLIVTYTPTLVGLIFL